jgi:hypothetical protein
MTLPWRIGELALLDGAMGTALIARGLPEGALPDSWVVERPGEVARVHARHAAAGSEGEPSRLVHPCVGGDHRERATNA